MTEERLIEILHEALDSRSRIDACQHSEHHEFIQQWIEREQIRTQRWEEIRRQVFGWGIIACIGTIGTVAAKKLGISL